MSNWEKIKTVKNFITGGGASVFIELLNTPRLGGPLYVRVRAKVGDQDLKATAVYLCVQSIEKIHVHNRGFHVSIGKRAPARQADTRRRTITWEIETIIEPIDGLEANGAFIWDGVVNLPLDGSATYHGTYAKHIWRVRGGLAVSGTHPKSSWFEFRIKG